MGDVGVLSNRGGVTGLGSNCGVACVSSYFLRASEGGVGGRYKDCRDCDRESAKRLDD